MSSRFTISVVIPFTVQCNRNLMTALKYLLYFEIFVIECISKVQCYIKTVSADSQNPGEY